MGSGDSNVSVHVEEAPYRSAAEYVLRLLARIIDRGFGAAGSPRIAICYGTAAPADAQLAVAIQKSDFFTGAFAARTAATLPFSDLLAAAQPNGLRGFVEAGDGSSIHVKLDVVAASFWFLTRYEEVVDARRDQHGRYMAAYSAAPIGMYDVPVVNRWFENLAAIVREAMGANAALPREQQTIALTHDVDRMRKYAGAGAVARGLLKGGLREAKLAAASAFGGQRDPYDSFDDLFTIKERVSAHSTFFMMTGAGGQHDCDYKLTDASTRGLMLRGRTFGDEIAVHPSWESGGSAELLAKEVKELQSANGQPVIGSRQHYLRFQNPATWRHLIAAGVKYDSSLGFADRAGFRCGWSGAFPSFDVEVMEELPIIEIPLVCMDVTLAAYEKVPAELCLERLTNLLDASTDHISGGAFVFLWHNSIADRTAFPGYWDTFEYFFSIASGSARFVPMRQLYAEYPDGVQHGPGLAGL